MRNILLLITALLLICFISNNELAAQEQSTRFLKVGDYNDYSDYRIGSLFQDSRGLIWMGTFGGLDRWDGSRIRSYSMPPFDSTGLPVTAVYSITEDDQNNLWLGSRMNGLVKYDLENEKFTHFNDPVKYPFFANINFIKYDPSGFLWLSTINNFYRFFPEEDRAELVQVQDSVIDNFQSKLIAFAMETDTLGNIWVTANWGLYYYDKENDVLKPQLFELPFSYGDPWPKDHILELRDMCIDENGIIYLLWQNTEIIRFNPYSKAIDFLWPKKFDEPSFMAGGGAIQIDGDGKIWMSSENNLVQFDILTGSVIEDGNIPITDIIKDKDGNILISGFEGIKLIDRNGSQIKRYTREYLERKGQGWITEILKVNQTYWIGTYGDGIIKLDSVTGKKVFYRRNEIAGSLSDNLIMKILKDRNNQIWIMTLNGLHLYDPVYDNFKRYSDGFKNLITEGRDGNFWILETKKLIRFNPDTYDAEEILLNDSLPIIQKIIDVYGFVQDTAGFLWMGHSYSKGLTRIDPRSGDCVRYRHDVNNPTGLPSDLITTIYYDSKNRMWVGTEAGLSQVKTFPQSDSIYCINYFLEEGLIGLFIFELTEDISGNIWVGTATGISILKTDGSIHNLDVDDGLSDPPLIWTLTSDTEGNIYTGLDNITIIPANFHKVNIKVPPVLITDFQISEESIYPGEKSPLKKSILFADQVDLKYHENFIRIEFAALNYTHPEKNRYRYILEGVDRDTVNAQLRSYAEYTDLSPGKYTFWATGSNNAGLWNTEGTQLRIIINPPPWATWWAYLGYCLVAGGFVLFIFSLIIKRNRAQHKMELEHIELEKIKEIEEAKTRFFTQISHEIRTPLSLILQPIESLYKGEVKGGESTFYVMIRRNALRLKDLLNQILDFSKLKSGKVRLVVFQQNIVALMRLVIANFESLAESHGIILKLDVAGSENISVYFDPDKIEKVMNNLLSNAIKFSPQGGHISVRIEQQSGTKEIKTTRNVIDNYIHLREKDVVVVSVTDTGVGIPNDQRENIFDRFYRGHQDHEYEGIGIGLSIAKEFVDLHKGAIWVESVVGKGSAFYVVLPMGKDHLSEDEIFIPDEIDEQESSLEMHTEFSFSDDKSDLAMETDKQTVLFIEDNEDMRNYVKRYFDKEYDFQVAKDGQEGFEKAIERIPDIIISDVMMPKMDGLELCRRLKDDRRTRHIPIILLTAKADKASKLSGLGVGADDYISKPFDNEELIIKVKNQLDQLERLREKFIQEFLLNDRKEKIKSRDDVFLTDLAEVVMDNLDDSTFSVEAMSHQIGLSRSQLFRKLKALTGQVPNEFIRSIRIKKATELLIKNTGNISEIAYAVGFEDPSYFTKCFSGIYHVAPSDYAKSILKKNN